MAKRPSKFIGLSLYHVCNDYSLQKADPGHPFPDPEEYAFVKCGPKGYSVYHKEDEELHYFFSSRPFEEIFNLFQLGD